MFIFLVNMFVYLEIKMCIYLGLSNSDSYTLLLLFSVKIIIKFGHLEIFIIKADEITSRFRDVVCRRLDQNVFFVFVSLCIFSKVCYDFFSIPLSVTIIYLLRVVLRDFPKCIFSETIHSCQVFLVV